MESFDDAQQAAACREASVPRRRENSARRPLVGTSSKRGDRLSPAGSGIAVTATPGNPHPRNVAR